MATNNAVNITGSGLVKYNGSGAFSAVTVSQYTVLAGGASNGISSIGPGSAGQVLQSGGASANPTYSTATYPSTSAASGKILYDNGTNFVASVPTFPASASATSRKIIVSDGTNWTASTETWAVPGASGNLLTSNGTNWISAAPSGTLTTVSVSVSSLEVKALKASPKQIIAAPGAGFTIIILSVQAKFIYGGTNAFTNGQNLLLTYGTSSGSNASSIFVSSSTINGTSTVYSNGLGATVTNGTFDNQAVVFSNAGASEITGNAADNNTITVQAVYMTVATPE